MKKQYLYLGLVIFILMMEMTNVMNVTSTAPLQGTMDLEFNMGFPGPQTTIPDWVGNITINGVQYGMAFFNIGTGKAFTSDQKGDTSFFGELWFIYESLDYQFDASTQVLVSFKPGLVLLAGNDQGVVSLANSLYRMNGAVLQANGIFGAWSGHTIHMNGVIQWDPLFAPGTFRIN